MGRRESLSAAEARRTALAAQGFADPRPDGDAGQRHFGRVLDRVGLLQIDSVNVLVRAHYLPAFSRLGPYPRALLDRAAHGTGRRRLFEYWGHEASLLPVALQPLLRWRMARAEAHDGVWSGIAQVARERPDFVEAVYAEVAARGPISAGELDGSPGRVRGRAGTWWERSDGKRALEWLFWAGRLTTATRRGFERLYDLPERVLPADVLAQPTPAPADAQRELVAIAARALGVATEPDLRDYFRLPPEGSKRAVAELVEAGRLLPVAVAGWDKPGYLDPDARIPRRITARALLSPFDSLIWERARTERLFGFRYRIGIYTPEHKRDHGYYVLPFLLGDRLVARVDLKADRAAGALLVQSAHGEAGIDPDAVAEPLAAALAEMAEWLELERVAVQGRGDLAPALGRVVAAPARDAAELLASSG